MPSTPGTSRLLLAAAWIGTALVAYSIGSLHSPAPDPAPTSGSGAPGTTVGSDKPDSATHDRTDGERPLDGARGTAGRTQAEILGQQPLGDYLKRILTLEDDIKRTSAFLEVLETLHTPEQIREALEAVAKSGRGWGRGASSREFAMLLQKWTTLDARGAATYALQSSSREERFMAMSNVLRNWTRQDPTAALAWAQTHGTAAPAEGDSSRDSSDGNFAVAMVVAQLARTDVEQALRIAAGEGDSRAASRLGDNLTEELFRQRGAEAARDAILALPESRLREAMLGEYADRTAKTDPPGAARWAAALPEGPGRSRAFAEAIAGWAERDAAAAGNYLNGVPPSTGTDAARERFAREISGKDPVGALSWAGTITGERERQDTTENVVRSWVRRDAENARAWVQQSNFSEETKQRLLTPANSRGRN